MRLEAAAVTHPGRMRPENEDNYCFHGSYPAKPGTGAHSEYAVFDGSCPLLMGVFDGMGGYQNGERASLIAAETAARFIPALSEARAQQTLADICTEANARICEEIEQTVKGKMGTTAAMLALCGSAYTVCNIGDSPVWLLRGGCLTELSYQHTEYQNYAAITGKKPEKGRKFPLTQHLGIQPEEMEIAPHFADGTLRIGDRFLLCSDGVTDMLSESALTEILSQPVADAGTLAVAIVRAALEAGGRDNITAAVICVCADE